MITTPMVLVWVGVPAGFALLYLLVPAFRPDDADGDESRPGEHEVEMIDGINLAYVALFVVPCGVALGNLFAWAIEAHFASLPAGICLPRGQRTIPAWICGFLLGMLAAFAVTTRLASVLFRAYYPAYERYLIRSSGVTNRQLVAILGLPAVALSVGWVTLAMDHYARFEEDRIVLNPLFGFGESAYPYDRVTHIVDASHYRTWFGAEREWRMRYIVFSDGTRWTSRDFSRSRVYEEREDPAAFEFVREKTGKELLVVRHIEDVPGVGSR